jgi:hypothetical protein
MRLILPVSLSLMLVATSSAVDCVIAQTPKHHRNAWQGDSTIFWLSSSRQKISKDETLKVHIHIVPRGDWQISGLRDDSADCQCRLDVKLPDEWLQQFDIVSVKETGKVVTEYDTSLERIRQYHRTPFDLVATLRAKQAVKDLRDFQLWVRYFTLNQKSRMCLPPTWRLVLDQKYYVTN